jgi:hypothetical protein
VGVTFAKVRNRHGLFLQAVTLTSHGAAPIGGPVVLVL